MFVDFSLYVDHGRNLRVLIFSCLGRGFAWLISLSISAKLWGWFFFVCSFLFLVVSRVICLEGEGKGLVPEEALPLQSTPASLVEFRTQFASGQSRPSPGRRPPAVLSTTRRRLPHAKGAACRDQLPPRVGLLGQVGLVACPLLPRPRGTATCPAVRGSCKWPPLLCSPAAIVEPPRSEQPLKTSAKSPG